MNIEDITEYNCNDGICNMCTDINTFIGSGFNHFAGTTTVQTEKEHQESTVPQQQQRHQEPTEKKSKVDLKILP